MLSGKTSGNRLQRSLPSVGMSCSAKDFQGSVTFSFQLHIIVHALQGTRTRWKRFAVEKYKVKELRKKLIALVKVIIPDSYRVLFMAMLFTALVFNNKTGVITSYHNLVFSMGAKTLMITVAIFIIISFIDKKEPVKFLNMNRISLTIILFGVLLTPIFILLSIIAENYLSILFPFDTEDEIAHILKGTMHGIKPPSINIKILMAFFAAFREELMRVYVFERIKKVFSKGFLAVFIILYSLYFGFGHFYQGNVGFLSTTLFSLEIFVVYLWKRNFYLLFLIHFLFDVFMLIVPPLILN